MKKALSILMIISIFLLCGCGGVDDDIQAPSTQNTTFVEDSAGETENTSSDDDSSKYSMGLISGGLNYSNIDKNPIEYNGDDVVMNIKLNIGNSISTDMGVYLNVQGLFLPFAMQEYSDESFKEAISDESESKVFHQLNFSEEYCLEGKDRYFSVRFNPDMFEKGSTVYPEITCCLKNTYLPKSGDGVSYLAALDYQASNIFGIFPPTLHVKADAKQQYKICENYDITPMTEEDAKDSENEIVHAEILPKGSDSFPYFIDTDGEDSVELTVRIHNVYTRFLKYNPQEVVVSVFVNNELYAAFDGSKYLKMTVEQNNYYTYDFMLNAEDLNEMNKIQVYVCQLTETDESPYNHTITSSPLYVKVGG